MDIRRRVDGHANLDQIGLTGIHSRLGAAVRLRLPPHAPSRDRAVALGSQLPPTGPVGDLHPPSVIHVQRTRSGYALPSLSARAVFIRRLADKIGRASCRESVWIRGVR